MKKYKTVKVVLGICAALGWWGVLYPQLTMTPDTYVVSEDDRTLQKQKEALKWDFDSEIYWELLNTDSSKIHFRSRLLQILSEAKCREK